MFRSNRIEENAEENTESKGNVEEEMNRDSGRFEDVDAELEGLDESEKDRINDVRPFRLVFFVFPLLFSFSEEIWIRLLDFLVERQRRKIWDKT